MDIWDILLVILIGFIAGIINVMAGGGSLLTMPLLIFLGLDSTMANGTNRVAIFFQNATAIAGFRSKGLSAGKFGVFLGIAAFFGAIIGSLIAVEIPDGLFNKILAIVMVLVVIMTLLNPSIRNKDALFEEQLSLKHQIMAGFALFLTGIYGGFIQAGTGLFIMASLSFINRFSLLKANVAKATIMIIYTIASLGVFAFNGQINYFMGLFLAISMSAGAWWASRWSSEKGKVYIKWFMIVAVIAMAVSLWLKKG